MYNTIICGPSVYNYKNTLFEVHSYFGPHPIRKDNHDPFKRVGKNSKFWAIWDEFSQLSEEEQHKYMIHKGGCETFK